jgi:hypothetical protein
MLLSLFLAWVHVFLVISMDCEIQIAISLNSKVNKQLKIIWAFRKAVQRKVGIFYSGYSFSFVHCISFVHISITHKQSVH